MDRLIHPPKHPKLFEFIEATFPFKLDAWQRVLCERLELLRTQRGQRLLIHGPPQCGKSIIVSQRFPSWLIGCDPNTRIKLACYNITHATEFSKINLQLMQEPEFLMMFPNTDCRLVMDNQEVWTTRGRSRFKDGQPSFKALGLRTGFVGQGADTLIIDDPYASPQEALSETIRESVWQFWESGAKVRLREDSNVVVMFHRYHSDDLAGKMYDQGGWEMLRFAAEADDDESMPDPMCREAGEILSPRLTPGFIEEQKRTPSVWLGQFQGRPLPPGGGMIKRSYFRTLTPDQVPPLVNCVFGGDLAVSKETTADYTVFGPLGVDANNTYYLFRPARGQWEPPQARREMMTRLFSFVSTTFPVKVVGLESVAALSGYVTEMRQEPEMAGYVVADIGRHGDKVLLASGWVPIAEQGRMVLVDDGSGWTETFLRECEGFPLGKKDDQVDWVGLSFETLRRVPRPSEGNVY